MSHITADREKLERAGRPLSLVGRVSSREDGEAVGDPDDQEVLGEEDGEETTTSFGEGAEVDGANLWKPKRTLRK